MTTSHLAPRANSGEALPRRSFARLDSFGFFAAPARKRLGLQLRKLTLIAIGALFAVQSLSASVATLAWDANPEPDIAGYKLSYGEAPGTYTTTVDVGNSTVTDISGLTEGKTYYFSVAAYNTTGAMSLPSAEISYTIGANSYSTEVSSNDISIHSVDSEDPDGYPASYAVDGDSDTFWHTEWRTNSPPPPHELQVDLGSILNLNGFCYLPRQDTYSAGNIGQYECYISADGTDWGNPIAKGSFSNTKDIKIVTFTATTGRYVRLRALTDANGGNHTNIAELTLLQSIEIPTEGINAAPVANAQSQNTDEDTPLDISLTGTDADANPLTFAVVSNPTKGTLSGTAPNLTYTPSADFNGTDSFTFRVNDGLVNSTAATISITITPVNDAPVALAKSVTTPEDTSIAVSLNATDADANPLTFTIVTNPTKGTLSGTAPNLTYTPSADFNGSDSFTFQVNDGLVNSSFATISITITPTNDAPVAVAKSVTTPEDTSIVVSLNATDADANPLTFTVVTNPTKGTLSGTPPNLTYTPSADFNGSDSFTFRANDGLVNSTAATVSITITPVNDAPGAIAKSITTLEDASIAVPLSATDADANPLTFAIVANPTKGTLSGTAPNLTYTPSADYNGSDSFAFRANDGLVNSTTATVSITITPVNDAPVAVAKSTSTPKNIPVAVALAAFDKDANPLLYSVVSGPTNGTLSGDAKNPTYTPKSNYSGNDSFTFQVNDGTVNSAVATISIEVVPTNEAPSPFAQSITTPEDTAVPVSLRVGDDSLTYSVATQPAHGSLSGTTPHLTYTPSADFNGSDSFTFLINDGTTDFISATATISVTPVNDAPTATSQILTTAEDTALPLVLSGSDKDLNNLSFIMETAPSNGTLTGTAPNFTYNPTANYNGSDQFTFRVNDGTVSSQTATVFITVTSVNDAPTALSESLTTTESNSLPVVLGGSDIDGNPLTFTVVKVPTRGSLSGTAPNLTYLPNAGFSGSDSFTFKANDGKLDSATATVFITVTPAIRTKPGKRKIFVSNSITLQTTGVQALSAQQLTTEPDAGTALTFTKTSGPAWLSISADGVISGTPDSSDVGDNSFTVTVTDSLGSSDEATLTIPVAGQNQAPTFINNPITFADASENEAYAGQNLAGQAVDPDPNDSLRYWKVSGPDWLNVALSGELSGTPPTGSAGMNSFTVGVADSSSAVAFSELRINVGGLPLPWSTANLGTGQLEGFTSYRAGSFTQAGAGAVGSTSDKFRFTYQTLSGDGEIIAKVAIQQTAGPSSFAGVMIRESLAPKSPHVFIGISDDKSYRQASRTKNGKKTSVKSSAPTGTTDSWIRIVRNAKKKQIYTYKSADGVNWTFLGTTKIKMAANCHVGLVVASGSDSTLTTSNFSNVYVAP